MNWILMWLHKLPFRVRTEDYQLTRSNAEEVSPEGMVDVRWKQAKWQAEHPRMSYLSSQWACELQANLSLLSF